MRFPCLLPLALMALPSLCPAGEPPGLELEGMERLLEECRARRLDLEALIIREKERVGGFEALSEEEAAFFETFLACRGIASGRREGCEVLKGLKGNLEDSYKSCRERQAQALWLWSAWREGDAAPCRDTLASPGTPVKPEDVERFCRVSSPFLRQKNPQALCRELTASGLLSGQAARECLPGFAFLDGPEGCQGLQGVGLRHACRELALLAAALRAGRSCPSPLCAALFNRDGARCSSYLSQASQSFCGRVAGETEPLRARREGQREKEIRLRKEVEFARQRRSELKVRMRAERERGKKQFKKGQPMEQVPPEVLDQMKRILLQGPKKGGEGPAKGPSTDEGRLP